MPVIEPTNNQKAIHLTGLVLLILSLFGPWGYDRINVPAQYTCEPPHVRLYGDFCGLPLSAMWIITTAGSELGWLVKGLLTGTAQRIDLRAALFFAASVLVILAPPGGLLVRLVRRDARRSWLLVFASLAALALAGFLISQQQVSSPLLLWGVWLYAIMALLLLVTQVIPNRFTQGMAKE